MPQGLFGSQIIRGPWFLRIAHCSGSMVSSDRKLFGVHGFLQVPWGAPANSKKPQKFQEAADLPRNRSTGAWGPGCRVARGGQLTNSKKPARSCPKVLSLSLPQPPSLVETAWWTVTPSAEPWACLGRPSVSSCPFSRARRSASPRRGITASCSRGRIGGSMLRWRG